MDVYHAGQVLVVAQWLRGRAPDFQLRELRFKSCATVSNHKPQANVFTLHCSSSLTSLSCLNEYLAIDIGISLRMNSLGALIAAWLP